METKHWPINSLVDIILARRNGREMALALGFSLPDATKIAVIISELGRKILEHAEKGTITLIAHTERETYIEVVAEGQGLDSADVERALEANWASGVVGLLGAKCLADSFETHPAAGRSTRITAAKWLPRKRNPNPS